MGDQSAAQLGHIMLAKLLGQHPFSVFGQEEACHQAQYRAKSSQADAGRELPDQPANGNREQSSENAQAEQSGQEHPPPGRYQCRQAPRLRRRRNGDLLVQHLGS